MLPHIKILLSFKLNVLYDVMITIFVAFLSCENLRATLC